MQHWELILFFFGISMVYASVGFGGGSSYLAALALYAIPFQEMKLTALVCNIIVVTGGTIIHVKNRQVNWRKILPLAIVSVPMAFIGAKMPIKQDTFFIVLGISLVVAGILLWLKTRNNDAELHKKISILSSSVIGGSIGFLSGLVGIGGGIFLSPILNLLNWDNAKKIAATASVFILINSISGLAGQFSKPINNIDITRIALLCIAVLAGGQIGSRISAERFNLLTVKRITAVVVLYAGIEVLYKHWLSYF